MTHTRLPRPSAAMLVALLALVVSLGGTSYAAVKIGSGQIKNNSLRSADIKNNQVSSADVRNGSLTAKDVKTGQLSARAYAYVNGLACQPLTAGTPCDFAQRKGITSVTRGSASGSYCIVAPGISAATTPALATPDLYSILDATLTAIVDERTDSTACPAGNFVVITMADFEDAAAPTGRGDVSFTVLIP